MFWTEAVAQLADLALPSTCAGCVRGRGPLCARCRAEILSLGRGAGAARAIRVHPDPLPFGMPSTWASAPLTPLLGALLTAYKDDGRRDLSAELAPLLALAVLAAGGTERSAVALVPVPTSDRARRRRGDRPLEQLAVAAGTLLPGSVRVVRGLRHVRDVADQSALDATQRRLNLTGALLCDQAAAASLRGHRVVIVDDIVTTGSTLVEAARALREQGLNPVAACLAATARRRRRSVVAPVEAD